MKYNYKYEYMDENEQEDKPGKDTNKLIMF